MSLNGFYIGPHLKCIMLMLKAEQLNCMKTDTIMQKPPGKYADITNECDAGTVHIELKAQSASCKNLNLAFLETLN